MRGSPRPCDRLPQHHLTGYNSPANARFSTLGNSAARLPLPVHPPVFSALTSSCVSWGLLCLDEGQVAFITSKPCFSWDLLRPLPGPSPLSVLPRTPRLSSPRGVVQLDSPVVEAGRLFFGRWLVVLPFARPRGNFFSRSPRERRRQARPELDVCWYPVFSDTS